MKISRTNAPHYSYRTTQDATKTHSGKKTTQSTRNFDQIQIQSGMNPRCQDLFVKEVTGKLSLELRKTTSSEQLDDIRCQIEQGNYPLQLDEIANKILLR